MYDFCVYFKRVGVETLRHHFTMLIIFFLFHHSIRKSFILPINVPTIILVMLLNFIKCGNKNSWNLQKVLNQDVAREWDRKDWCTARRRCQPFGGGEGHQPKICQNFWKKHETRMHSSRMRTTRSLTVSGCILRTPPSNHACPPATMHAPPKPCMPPLATTHAPHHAHPHPLATMHALWQPCMPPSNHAHPPATMHAPHPVNRMTNRCKNITLPQTSFAGGNYERHMPEEHPPPKYANVFICKASRSCR